MSIHETISKNNLALFKWPKPKAKSKQAKAVAVLKDDVALFPDCLLWQKTENVTCPPSLGMKISPFLPPYMNLVNYDFLRSLTCCLCYLKMTLAILQRIILILLHLMVVIWFIFFPLLTSPHLTSMLMMLLFPTFSSS